MNSQFNAIDYSHQLQSVGIPPPHAEMHARLLSEALSNCAATKGDLLALKNELSGRMDIFEQSVKLELAGMRVEIANMRTEMHSEFSTMRSEIKYTRWILNFVVALLVALIAKSFFP